MEKQPPSQINAAKYKVPRLSYFPHGYDDVASIRLVTPNEFVVESNPVTRMLRWFANEVYAKYRTTEPLKLDIDLETNQAVQEITAQFLVRADQLLQHTLPSMHHLCDLKISLRTLELGTQVSRKICETHRESLGVGAGYGALELDFKSTKYCAALLTWYVGNETPCSCSYCTKNAQQLRQREKITELDFYESYLKLVRETATQLLQAE